MNSRKDRIVTGHWWEVPWREERGRGEDSPGALSRPAALSMVTAALGAKASVREAGVRAGKREGREHVLLWGAEAAPLYADFLRGTHRYTAALPHLLLPPLPAVLQASQSISNPRR